MYPMDSPRQTAHEWHAETFGIESGLIGKSWLACALAHSACRHGHSASYRRLPRLLSELAIARADGSYPKLLASLAKTEVLVIDDFGFAKLSAENRRDLLEVIEDRYGIRSTPKRRIHAQKTPTVDSN